MRMASLQLLGHSCVRLTRTPSVLCRLWSATSCSGEFGASYWRCSASPAVGRRQLTTTPNDIPPVGDTPFRRTHAQELIVRLSAAERSMLLHELQSYEKRQSTGSSSSQINVSDLNMRPSASQLWAVSIHNAIPFIGFGFLDNFIMIVAGDYIDLTIGATLGITTLAAAALGNLISDVAGIGSAWYVESLAAKVGVTIPILTKEQLGRSSTIWSTYLGRAWGVSLGCLLGMVPLLFLRPKKKKNGDGDDAAESTEDTLV